MYVYDRKWSDAQCLLEEQPFTSRTVGHNSDYPGQGVGGVLGRVGPNSTSMWAHEGLGRARTALPPKFRWGDKTFSTNIQSSFDRAIHAVRNDASFSHLPDVRTVPIAIMALDRNGGRPVAGQREFKMFYSGSLLKVVAMYAA